MWLIILLTLTVIAAGTASSSNEVIPAPYRSTDAPSRDLVGKLKSWADRFPLIKALIDSKATQLPAELRQVTGNGYTHYSQDAFMQAIEGVDADKFDNFMTSLANTLKLSGDARAAFTSSMQLIRFSDGTDWSLIDMIFNQQDGANCKYVCILGYRNTETETYDFVVADFKIAFKLAPNIIFIEERKSYLWGLIQTSNIREERIPATLKLQDVELLKTFFCQSALAKFAQMLDVKVPGFEDAFAVDPMTVLGLISAGLDVAPKLMNLFKTTSTSSIIKEIAGEGFSHYEQSSKTNFVDSIEASDVRKEVIPLLSTIIGLKGDPLEGVEAAIRIGLVSASNTWNDFKIAFSQDKTTNQVQFADVIVANRGNGKFNLLTVGVTQAFRLAPKVQYIENSKSYVGGLYSETKIERKEYPSTLTEKDLEMLMAFFHITVFKRLATRYGVALPKELQVNKPELKF